MGKTNKRKHKENFPVVFSLHSLPFVLTVSPRSIYTNPLLLIFINYHSFFLFSALLQTGHLVKRKRTQEEIQEGMACKWTPETGPPTAPPPSVGFGLCRRL